MYNHKNSWLDKSMLESVPSIYHATKSIIEIVSELYEETETFIAKKETEILNYEWRFLTNKLDFARETVNYKHYLLYIMHDIFFNLHKKDMIRKESDVVDIAYKYLKKVFNLDDADDALWNEIKQIPNVNYRLLSHPNLAPVMADDTREPICMTVYRLFMGRHSRLGLESPFAAATFEYLRRADILRIGCFHLE